MKTLFKYYWLALSVTLLLWLFVGWKLGLAALITTILLTVLETTFSADNAIVNSRVLVHMSPFWQKLFITFGIFIAVFVIRFILPIALVMATAQLDFMQTVNLSLNHPDEYGAKIHQAEPFINSFGGIFLLLVALYFFVDRSKKSHWLAYPELFFSNLGRRPHVPLLIALAVITILTVTVEPSHRLSVLGSSLAAVALYCALHFFINAMKVHHKQGVTQYVGKTAFIAFLYLEVLDASFSLDGVIGAFAITNNAIIIMAGLGAGAIWVREMTIHLVKTKTLGRFVYLESGAHWAIMFLGAIMLLKLQGIELPEILVGSLGVIFITLSIISSRRFEKMRAKAL